jgi:hypothetical protein
VRLGLDSCRERHKYTAGATMPSIHDVIQEAADLLVDQTRRQFPDVDEINRSNLLRAALLIGLEKLVASEDPGAVRAAIAAYVAAKDGVLPRGSPLSRRLGAMKSD